LRILRQLLQKPAFQRADVAVLGGGISGITTAVVLQALGLNPVIVTESTPKQSGSASDPRVPTDFAMASAYPHHLQTPYLPQITEASQAVFGELARHWESGVGVYLMYEVFEEAPAAAPLAEKRMKFHTFEGRPGSFRKSLNPPVRPGAEAVWGWRFETYFADMPIYLQFLWNIFRGKGGQFVTATVDGEFLSECPFPIVDCLGAGAPSLFDDEEPAVIVRGKQVLVPGAPVLYEQNIPVAFNYTPLAEVFRRADGGPEYVHFFARSDGWVLGQTREPGSFDAEGAWQGAAVDAEELTIDGISIPAPIVALNADLLSAWRGVTLRGRRLKAREGYRYYRAPQAAGLRLEIAQSRGNLVVHNYGHGGSGVTVSWGCATEAAKLLLAASDLRARPAVNGALERMVSDLVLNSALCAAV
jgi:D-amino-acid oxidase